MYRVSGIITRTYLYFIRSYTRLNAGHVRRPFLSIRSLSIQWHASLSKTDPRRRFVATNGPRNADVSVRVRRCVLLAIVVPSANDPNRRRKTEEKMVFAHRSLGLENNSCGRVLAAFKR